MWTYTLCLERKITKSAPSKRYYVDSIVVLQCDNITIYPRKPLVRARKKKGNSEKKKASTLPTFFFHWFTVSTFPSPNTSWCLITWLNFSFSWTSSTASKHLFFAVFNNQVLLVKGCVRMSGAFLFCKVNIIHEYFQISQLFHCRVDSNWIPKIPNFFIKNTKKHQQPIELCSEIEIVSRARLGQIIANSKDGGKLMQKTDCYKRTE